MKNTAEKWKGMNWEKVQPAEREKLRKWRLAQIEEALADAWRPNDVVTRNDKDSVLWPVRHFDEDVLIEPVSSTVKTETYSVVSEVDLEFILDRCDIIKWTKIK